MEKRVSHIVKRDGQIVPFDQEKITVAVYKAGAALSLHDRVQSERISDLVAARIHESFSAENLPTVEGIQDIVEETLIANGLAKIAKAYILYREERARERRKKKGDGGKALDIIPYKKLWQVLWWNVEHQCETVEKLNRHIRENTIGELVLAAENAYHEDVKAAARAILERRDQVRLVIIAGPSSSGKTTTTIKLSEELRKEGISLVALNVDNYFFDLEFQPKDEFGDYDFETPEALELQLIDEHLCRLLAQEPVSIPRYDFKAGRRHLNQTTFQIRENEVILIDTLHGLYEKMTENVPEERKFKLYIETLGQLKDREGNFTHWTDTRLLRRMVRDKDQRNHKPDKTIEHWHYVRRSELKHIIPYIPTVDYIVNGAMCYDLPLLKRHLGECFPEFVKRYEDDPHHHDAYVRAKRIQTLFESLETLRDESCIPPNSMVREFIGGSVYKY